MSMINRYKIKDGIAGKDVVAAGAIKYDDELVIIKYFEVNHSDICVEIMFPENLSDWNDENYILVTDTDAGVPYSLFKKVRDGKQHTSIPEYAKVFFDEYNKFMNDLGLFKVV